MTEQDNGKQLSIDDYQEDEQGVDDTLWFKGTEHFVKELKRLSELAEKNQGDSRVIVSILSQVRRSCDKMDDLIQCYEQLEQLAEAFS